MEIGETEMFADEEPKANENQEDEMVELGSNQTNAFTFKILRHSVKCRRNLHHMSMINVVVHQHCIAAKPAID